MNIELANGKSAVYKSSREAVIPDMGIDKPTTIHVYQVPCPVCDCSENNLASSKDQLFFLTNQIVCRYCGVFFRPVVSPEYIKTQILLRQIVSD